MILSEENMLDEAVIAAAKELAIAAVTAPKACGRDTIRTAVVTGEDLVTLAAEMDRIEEARESSFAIFSRDAALVRRSPAVVLIGVKNQSRGLHPCGLCGHGDCASCKKAGGHCAFDDMDLGIALGSAASRAADLRLDNRMLYTAGMAAMSLKLLGEEVSTIVAIPLSCTNKNIYFDKK